jgi:hypothetical protein
MFTSGPIVEQPIDLVTLKFSIGGGDTSFDLAMRRKISRPTPGKGRNPHICENFQCLTRKLTCLLGAGRRIQHTWLRIFAT